MTGYEDEEDYQKKQQELRKNAINNTSDLIEDKSLKNNDNLEIYNAYKSYKNLSNNEYIIINKYVKYKGQLEILIDDNYIGGKPKNRLAKRNTRKSKKKNITKSKKHNKSKHFFRKKRLFTK